MPDFLSGFYFTVQALDPVNFFEADFKEISGLEKEMKTEEVVCGGENRFKYKLPSGSSYNNLILKRAVVSKSSGLLDWCSSVIDGGLTKAICTKDIQVQLKNSDGKPALCWTFKSAYPIKYSSSDLNSQEGSLLVETIELAYLYFDIKK
ncbi:phage tail protein [Bacterioplanoides sp.]|uniref:phage tail protein n=1 Tax=Bacterioplanoides sp. TaxID=2066072 RepID=UPI003B59500A